MNKQRKLTQFDEGFGEVREKPKKKPEKNEFEKFEEEVVDYKKKKGMSRFESKKRDKDKYDHFDDDWN